MIPGLAPAAMLLALALLVARDAGRAGLAEWGTLLGALVGMAAGRHLVAAFRQQVSEQDPTWARELPVEPGQRFDLAQDAAVGHLLGWWPSLLVLAGAALGGSELSVTAWGVSALTLACVQWLMSAALGQFLVATRPGHALGRVASLASVLAVVGGLLSWLNPLGMAALAGDVVSAPVAWLLLPWAWPSWALQQAAWSQPAWLLLLFVGPLAGLGARRLSRRSRDGFTVESGPPSPGPDLSPELLIEGYLDYRMVLESEFNEELVEDPGLKPAIRERIRRAIADNSEEQVLEGSFLLTPEPADPLERLGAAWLEPDEARVLDLAQPGGRGRGWGQSWLFGAGALSLAILLSLLPLEGGWSGPLLLLVVGLGVFGLSGAVFSGGLTGLAPRAVESSSESTTAGRRRWLFADLPGSLRLAYRGLLKARLIRALAIAPVGVLWVAAVAGAGDRWVASATPHPFDPSLGPGLALAAGLVLAAAALALQPLGAALALIATVRPWPGPRPLLPWHLILLLLAAVGVGQLLASLVLAPSAADAAVGVFGLAWLSHLGAGGALAWLSARDWT